MVGRPGAEPDRSSRPDQAPRPHTLTNRQRSGTEPGKTTTTAQKAPHRHTARIYLIQHIRYADTMYYFIDMSAYSAH